MPNFDRVTDAMPYKGLAVQQDDGLMHINDGGRAIGALAAKESDRG